MYNSVKLKESSPMKRRSSPSLQKKKKKKDKKRRPNLVIADSEDDIELNELINDANKKSRPSDQWPDISKFRVVDLKDLCIQLGLETKGKKADLQNRLYAHFEANSKETPPTQEAAEQVLVVIGGICNNRKLKEVDYYNSDKGNFDPNQVQEMGPMSKFHIKTYYF